MPPDFATRLDAFAAVIVRVGLNLQRGQRLLIAEPYELHGVERSAAIIVDAVKRAAGSANGRTAVPVEVIWGDRERLRNLARTRDWRGLTQLVSANARKMDSYVRNGDAVLFLTGSQSKLMEGIAPVDVAELRKIGNEYFGGVAQPLMEGATNWTAAPAPSEEWARAIFPQLPPAKAPDELWSAVFEAMRISPDSIAGEKLESAAIERWRAHLSALEKRRDELNRRKFKYIHFVGPGVDLTVKLPNTHRWSTANLQTKSGIPFVANLPTEEIFTMPDKNSTVGHVRIARPIVFGGATIDGIELKFENGRVVEASAKIGTDLLRRLIDTDEGSGRLGEVALVDEMPGAMPRTWFKHPLFHHTLLDENAGSHIALGESYPFCLSSPNPDLLNRSLIHVDLPIAAKANLRA